MVDFIKEFSQYPTKRTYFSNHTFDESAIH